MSGADLNKTIFQAMRKPWKMGVHDCTQFAIDCEIALTGKTLFPEFYRTYGTSSAGFGILKRLGFFSTWECASSRLEEVPLDAVKRGDLIGHHAPNKSLAIAANRYSFWAANEKGGVSMLPMDLATKAWRF